MLAKVWACHWFWILISNSSIKLTQWCFDRRRTRGWTSFHTVRWWSSTWVSGVTGKEAVWLWLIQYCLHLLPSSNKTTKNEPTRHRGIYFLDEAQSFRLLNIFNNQRRVENVRWQCHVIPYSSSYWCLSSDSAEQSAFVVHWSNVTWDLLRSRGRWGVYVCLYINLIVNIDCFPSFKVWSLVEMWTYSDLYFFISMNHSHHLWWRCRLVVSENASECVTWSVSVFPTLAH